MNLFSQPKLPGNKRDWKIFTLPETSRDQSSFGKSCILEIHAGSTNSVSKNLREIFLSIYWISQQPQSQNENKKFLNYASILTIVNWNWLDSLPPLRSHGSLNQRPVQLQNLHGLGKQNWHIFLLLPLLHAYVWHNLLSAHHNSDFSTFSEKLYFSADFFMHFRGTREITKMKFVGLFPYLICMRVL